MGVEAVVDDVDAVPAVVGGVLWRLQISDGLEATDLSRFMRWVDQS